MVKKALITGITGQDGSYLAEFLLNKRYEVHGLRRHASTPNLSRIRHILSDPRTNEPGIGLHYGDMTDTSSLIRLIQEVEPDEIYNLAAQSHVKVSFEIPEYTADVGAMGILKILEALRHLGVHDKVRVYQASTSEIFGTGAPAPQNENTPFKPVSPYGVAKLYAYWTSVSYRESYGVFSCNGILFNHESPRRDPSFVTRKITVGVSRIALGLQDKLYLGNLSARRDWGYSPDYVEAMWLILQQDQPDDYVIATGETHEVREFVEKAFGAAGMSLSWKGSGLEEEAYDKKTGKQVVAVDPWYFRPTDIDQLVGDYSKAKELLGWKPKTTFNELVALMVQEDLKIAESNPF